MLILRSFDGHGENRPLKATVIVLGLGDFGNRSDTRPGRSTSRSAEQPQTAVPLCRVLVLRLGMVFANGPSLKVWLNRGEAPRGLSPEDETRCAAIALLSYP